MMVALSSSPQLYPALPHAEVASDAARAVRGREQFEASPLHRPSALAFAQAERALLHLPEHVPIVMDSGCGTGRSTRRESPSLASPCTFSLF